MEDHEQPPGQRWLTLSEAALIVGVHPGTLRDWAERGLVVHLRTPGGHRRFTERDLQAFITLRSQGGALEVLGPGLPAIREIEDRAIQQIRGNTPAGAVWRTAYDQLAVERQREQGRRLLGLALHYVSRQATRNAVLVEAEEIGQQYGREAAIRQISLPETVRAFTFFRDSLIRAARPVALAERGDEADDRLNQDLRGFLDVVFYAMLGAFEHQQRQLLTGEAHNPA